MTAHGPFHSLSDTDKQALTDKLRSGASVLHAASELGLNYGHALNYAHTLPTWLKLVRKSSRVNPLDQLTDFRRYRGRRMDELPGDLHLEGPVFPDLAQISAEVIPRESARSAH